MVLFWNNKWSLHHEKPMPTCFSTPQSFYGCCSLIIERKWINLGKLSLMYLRCYGVRINFLRFPSTRRPYTIYESPTQTDDNSFALKRICKTCLIWMKDNCHNAAETNFYSLWSITEYFFRKRTTKNWRSTCNQQYRNSFFAFMKIMHIWRFAIGIAH